MGSLAFFLPPVASHQCDIQKIRSIFDKSMTVVVCKQTKWWDKCSLYPPDLTDLAKNDSVIRQKPKM